MGNQWRKIIIKKKPDFRKVCARIPVFFFLWAALRCDPVCAQYVYVYAIDYVCVWVFFFGFHLHWYAHSWNVNAFYCYQCYLSIVFFFFLTFYVEYREKERPAPKNSLKCRTINPKKKKKSHQTCSSSSKCDRCL